MRWSNRPKAFRLIILINTFCLKVLFLLLVKFETKKGAGNQDVFATLPCHDKGRVEYYKLMSLQAVKEITWERLPVYQYHQRPDCQSKITWSQVYVLARHFFSIFTVFIYQQRILRVHGLSQAWIPLFLSPLLSYPSNIEIIFDFSDIITKFTPHFKILDPPSCR